MVPCSKGSEVILPVRGTEETNRDGFEAGGAVRHVERVLANLC